MIKMKFTFFIVIIFLLASCQKKEKKVSNKIIREEKIATVKTVSLIVLGNVQDGGSPHIGCKKDCCKNLFEHPDKNRMVVSLGLIDPINKKSYLFEATPDLPMQMKNLKKFCSFSDKEVPDGIFLTHAHIGHYSGLMYLGKEAMNADSVPVFAMPRMKEFLESNGPWSQLVEKKNISIKQLSIVRLPITLDTNLSVTALKVPHRDEFSETIGFIIRGPKKSALFIPDIDKWEKWVLKIEEVIEQVDYAFIDGTFYNGNELKTRNIAEIPHPFAIESMEKFKNLPLKEKNKIYFIHFNHTNKLLDEKSEETKTVLKNGFRVARLGMVFEM